MLQLFEGTIIRLLKALRAKNKIIFFLIMVFLTALQVALMQGVAMDIFGASTATSKILEVVNFILVSLTSVAGLDSDGAKGQARTLAADASHPAQKKPQANA